jgi:hypothetical protein
MGPPEEPDGIISLTQAAEFTLHVIAHPRGMKFQPLYHPSELQEVGHTKECALPTQDHVRIQCHDIRPLWRHGADGLLIHLEQQSFAGAIRSLAYADELLPMEGMEGVRDPHKTRRSEGNVCIPDRATSAWSGVVLRPCGTERERRRSR